MFLMIVGTGAMGKTVSRCAEEDPFFDKIVSVEPTEKNWPEEKADLIIDFSHPKAIKGIYEYCREKGGNIPVVIGTAGRIGGEERVIRLGGGRWTVGGGDGGSVGRGGGVKV